MNSYGLCRRPRIMSYNRIVNILSMGTSMIYDRCFELNQCMWNSKKSWLRSLLSTMAIDFFLDIS